MHRLNYNHLYYFWIVAQEGSLTRAASRLSLSHSTISAQIHALEEVLGNRLFDRRREGLALTAVGFDVLGYASEVFRLCSEMVDVAHGVSRSRRALLRIGLVHSIPATIASRLLQPAFEAAREHHLQILRGESKILIRELAHSKLHMILADMPPPKHPGYDIHRHLLGKTQILLYAPHDIAQACTDGFPQSVARFPLILPTAQSAMRALIERWFTDRGISVSIAIESDDPGIIRCAGLSGHGIFPVRAAVESEIEPGSGTVRIGALTDLHERYYLITQQRRLTHPVESAIADASRNYLQRV